MHINPKPRKPLKRGKPPNRRKKKFGPSLRYEIILGGAVRKYPDNREVCQNNTAGDREYERRIQAMFERQDGVCCLCPRFIEFSVTFEHSDLRGAGGARRDDRIEIDGKPINGAAHFWCNSEKGSRRLPVRQED